MGTNLSETYIKKRNNFYRSNGVFIARIVQSYECPKCLHLSKTLVESDFHFKQFHQKFNEKVFTQDFYDKNVFDKESLILVNKNQAKVVEKTFVKTIGSNLLKIIDKTPEVVVKKVLDKSLDNNVLIAVKKLLDNKVSEENTVKKVKKVLIDDDSNKGVDRVEIETGFKDFEEVNCVSNLKTYSRKKLIKVESDLSEAKVSNNEDLEKGEEPLISSSGRVLRPGLYECDICGEIYSQVLLNRHKNIHISPFCCDYPYCEEKFATESELSAHQRSHEKVVRDKNEKRIKAYKCDLCDRKYENEHDMKKHRNIHTNPKVCDYPNCGKKFAVNSTLKHHKLTHNKNYKFRCSICNKVFPYYWRLRQHSKFHTDPVVCEFEDCGKKFVNYSEMKLHSIVHSDNKPFKCDWPGCEFTAKQRYALIPHKKQVHSEMRAFKCDWKGCGKRFKTSSTLSTHIKNTHKNIRNFVCEWPDCGNRYKNRSDLTRHIRSHTGERPYICDNPGCEKRFGSREVLVRHKAIHTGLRPYKCDYCSATFGAKSTMDTHKKLIHKCDYIKRSHFDNKKKKKR